MKKAIVYGGAGFVGSHVADALTDAGCAVRVFDRAPSPYLRDGQEMVVGDMLDPDSVRAAARGCHYVYNFAAVMSIDEAKRLPVEAVKVNVLGNTYALEAARAAKAERFLLASTVYVYGRSGGVYRATKQSCEQLVETYHEEYGLDYTILRYGSLYGRRADERNGIHRMLKSALVDGKVRYNGTGEELREYIHVEDAARLSVDALKPEYANLPLTLTGHHPMRVRDVMEMLREMLGDRVPVEFSNEPVEGHYNVTPYQFHPRVGKKLVSTLYTDMGQGLLDCLADIRTRLETDEPARRAAKPRRKNRA